MSKKIQELKEEVTGYTAGKFGETTAQGIEYEQVEVKGYKPETIALKLNEVIRHLNEQEGEEAEGGQLDSILLKVRFAPTVKSSPAGGFVHDIEEYHDKVLTEAKAAIIAWAKGLVPPHIDNWSDVDSKKIGERTASSGNLGLYRLAYNQCCAEVLAAIEREATSE